MKRYVSLRIEQLVSDVPVDPVHTRELADSIMTKGQLAPVIIREESREVIDGFHRIAAMKELGFNEVECVLTPCDDEGFWDFRIIQASLHKNITFARAVEWIDKVFGLSLWRDKYKNAWNLFDTATQGYGPKEAQEWVQAKAKTWGLSPVTIKNWLYTKQSLAEDVLEKAKASPLEGEEIKFSHYVATAESLPGKPELQRQVLEKASKEQLAPHEIRTVAQALRRAEDEEEVQSILKQPVSRTEEEMVREAKVEKILTRPVVEKPEREERELKGATLLYWLDLEKMTASARGLTKKQMDVLPPNHKEILYNTGEECIREITKVNDYLKPEKKLEVPYRLKEG